MAVKSDSQVILPLVSSDYSAEKICDHHHRLLGSLSSTSPHTAFANLTRCSDLDLLDLLNTICRLHSIFMKIPSLGDLICLFKSRCFCQRTSILWGTHIRTLRSSMIIKCLGWAALWAENWG